MKNDFVKKIIIIFGSICMCLLMCFFIQSINNCKCQYLNDFDNRADMRGYKLLKDKNHMYQANDLKSLILKIKEGFSGVIYFGFESCPFCNQVVPILNYIAKEYGQVITYVNIYNYRFDKNGNKLNTFLDEYTSIQLYLKDYLKEDKTLYVPCVVFVKKGEIIKYIQGIGDCTNNLANEYRKGFEKIGCISFGGSSRKNYL